MELIICICNVHQYLLIVSVFVGELLLCQLRMYKVLNKSKHRKTDRGNKDVKVREIYMKVMNDS